MEATSLVDHARNPRNMGQLEEPDGISVQGQDCGDVIIFQIKVTGNRLVKVRYLVKGCAVLVACCSMTSLLAEGKTVWEAMQITPQEVEKALGGLPLEERHCSSYAVNALYSAIKDLFNKKGEKVAGLARESRGEGWRSLYIRAQRG